MSPSFGVHCASRYRSRFSVPGAQACLVAQAAANAPNVSPSMPPCRVGPVPQHGADTGGLRAGSLAHRKCLIYGNIVKRRGAAGRVPTSLEEYLSALNLH